MNSRILPFDEWSKLAHTEAAAVYPYLDPARAHIVVVEQDGAIIGCHVLMDILHAECLWIDPAFRGRTSVARRLWTRVQATAKALGVRTMVTSACDDRVRGLLEHVGAVKLNGDHFVVSVKG